ncbi:MAG: secretin N-terminal domain-containing protein [Phycisphaerales bacterium]
MPRTPRTTRSTVPTAAAALVLAAGAALAQNEAPAPAMPGGPAPVLSAPESRPAPAEARPAAPRQGPNGRKALEGPPTKLAFNRVTVEQLIPFLVEATGKVIMPQQDVMSMRITILNDREIPRNKALDLVILALQQNGIAVIEREDTVALRSLAELTRGDVPVIGSEESVLQREDEGTIVEKVFRLRNSNAKAYGDFLKNTVPDYAKITVDEDSNQIAVMGNIALLKRLEVLIGELDRMPDNAVKTETFRLRYADAEKVVQNIQDLFSPDGTGRQGGARGGGGGGRGNQPQNQPPFFRFQGPQGETSTAAPQTLRVSANTQQNSVTVVADPAVLDQIRQQVEEYWDVPLPDEVVKPKVYQLQYSDPVKVRALLEGLFGRPTTTGGGQQGGGGGGGGGQPVGTSATQGAGRLAGQFSFQAIPDANQLVVISKSPDNLKVIDEIIAELDRPQTIGLPAIVALKHADAEDLAEQLNTLLAQDGTIAQINRSARGLTDSSSTASPFSSTTTTDPNTGQSTTQQTSANVMPFWWQRGRPPTDRQANSNLIGQVRIVPVWRQNALMVMAPPEYKNSVVTLVEQLDQPGRQVLISAVIVEVQREDALSLGLRWSSQNITPTNADNSISIGGDASGTKDNLLPSLFDTSVLNANVNLNVILQALAQKTDVNILSEPKVFTSDNQEAEFFSGQDIPFITESQPNTQGNLVQSFDYKAVGIQLRVRPRITFKHDVDLRVNVELSSIVPGQTLFGGAIVDRRETTTQLIVQNGQTVVISGILRAEDTDVIRKIPFLGSLPLIGPLFRSTDKTKTNTELLVFITPLVVDNESSMDEVNERYRAKLKERLERLEKEIPALPGGSKPDIETAPPPSPPPAPAGNAATE